LPERILQAKPRLARAAVIVDAILGTGFSGNVRSPLDLAIEAINEAGGAAKATIVAVDLPSGLDCDTGAPSNATVRAAHTITFVAAKAGFAAPAAGTYTGQVHIADIGAPAALVQEILAAASG
jgi:NAD(P)H-hydrate epimerase